MKYLAAAAILLGIINCPSVYAEERLTKPKELDTLGQFVGHWTSEVASKPAAPGQRGVMIRTVSQAEWILDGWFLQHIELSQVIDDPDKVQKSLRLWTYDAKMEKFVTWAFHSPGNSVSSSGNWDAVSKTFTLANVGPLPNSTAKVTEQFLDEKTIKGNLTFNDNVRRTLADLAWTRNRQTELEGMATREEWSKVGPNILPLPDDLKKLEPWIGEWDSEFRIVGPSVGSPKEIIRSQGKLTVEWILDGRFLRIVAENGKDRFLWIIAYDSVKGVYRRYTFTNAGQMGESSGTWNGEFDTIDWNAINERPGTFLRFIGQHQRPDFTLPVEDSGADPHPNDGQRQDYMGERNGMLRISILRHDAKGKFYESLGVTSTRRK
jgi:hypothetical protein